MCRKGDGGRLFQRPAEAAQGQAGERRCAVAEASGRIAFPYAGQRPAADGHLQLPGAQNEDRRGHPRPWLVLHQPWDQRGQRTGEQRRERHIQKGDDMIC